MADLFTRAEVGYGGAFHSQLGIVGGGLAGLGVLMQNLQLQYAQQVTRIYELGTAGAKTNIYYVAGRAQGQVSVGHIIGPSIGIGAFYAQYADVCQASKNDLSLTLGPNMCDFAGEFVIAPGAMNLTYTCKYCVLTQIGMSVSAQDFVINENSSLMFGGLTFQG